MKPALLLASPIIRRRLAARGAVRVLRSLQPEALSAVDQAFLRLAMEIFSLEGQEKPLTPTE